MYVICNHSLQYSAVDNFFFFGGAEKWKGGGDIVSINWLYISLLQ